MADLHSIKWRVLAAADRMDLTLQGVRIRMSYAVRVLLGTLGTVNYGINVISYGIISGVFSLLFGCV